MSLEVYPGDILKETPEEAARKAAKVAIANLKANLHQSLENPEQEEPTGPEADEQ